MASIPSGWTRETTLDGKYIQGAPTGGDSDLTSRGSTTHTHTSPAHTPIQNAHSAVGGSTTYTSTDNTASGAGSSFAISHQHAFTSPTTVATNQSSTVNFGANSSNNPPFQDVIWIKSDGTPTGIPTNAYGFFESDILPSNWSRVQAGRYLKGAAALGNGGATGGAPTHTHISDAHTHGQDPHTHADFTSDVASGAVATTPTNEGASVLQLPHTHGLSVSSQTATNQSTTNTTDAVSHEPVFKKLNIIQNGGAADLPSAIIALWGGTNAAIPTGWTRYTALDGFFPKGAAAGEGLTTGGSLTHTHTAVCQPTQNSHSHGITQTSSATFTSVGAESLSGATVRQTPDHNHTWTDSGTVATNQALTYNVDACASEAAYPPYVRLIYIQFGSPTPPGPTAGVYTSYSLGLFDISDPHSDVLPEVAAQIQRGDTRYLRPV